jgi:hypothetical protein
MIKSLAIDSQIARSTLELLAEEFGSSMRLGQSELDHLDPVAAEVHFRRAIAIDDDQVSAWNQLGVSLHRQHRDREAVEAFENAERVTARTGEDRSSFVNLARHHLGEGRIEDAIAVLEKILPHRPSVSGHSTYAQALFIAGHLADGWSHNEFRRLSRPLLALRHPFSKPMWAGQDLHGKTLVLRLEQGYGDTIQFLRYAPCLKALGATVLLPRFDEVASGFPGADRLFAVDESPDFDYYINLPSLPWIFGTEVDSIPNDVPYVKAEPERVARWAERLGETRGALRVGVVWAGSVAHARDRERSIGLASFEPLLRIEGVRFFSLQKESTGEGQATEKASLVNLGPELEDFSDTAAVISQLDLVICVDTAVAHLAGALGKPVWVLLQKDPDWRWMLEREDSPWYPTMRLFRQRRHGDWPEVIERVKVALEQCVGSGVVETPASAVKPTRPMLRPKPTLARLAPGHKPGFSAVVETRVGIVQYFPDEPVVGDSISWYGEYLQGQLDLLRPLIQPGATVLEAGAGVGMHALSLAAALGPTGRLFLYESRPLLQRVLRQNLEANRVGNVTLMRGALGAAAEAGVSETIDGLQLERLQLLKIGADAPAMEVLGGATDAMWRLRPVLFIGVKDEAVLKELSARVKDFGYRCWRQETAVFNRQNFNCREDDIFAGSKASALLAIPEEIYIDIALEGCVELL